MNHLRSSKMEAKVRGEKGMLRGGKICWENSFSGKFARKVFFPGKSLVFPLIIEECNQGKERGMEQNLRVLTYGEVTSLGLTLVFL